MLVPFQAQHALGVSVCDQFPGSRKPCGSRLLYPTRLHHALPSSSSLSRCFFFLSSLHAARLRLPGVSPLPVCEATGCTRSLQQFCFLSTSATRYPCFKAAEGGWPFGKAHWVSSLVAFRSSHHRTALSPFGVLFPPSMFIFYFSLNLGARNFLTACGWHTSLLPLTYPSVPEFL